MKSHHRKQPALLASYAMVQQMCEGLKSDVEFYQAQNATHLRRAIDAEQRNLLLKDQVRILRNLLAQARDTNAQRVQVDELQTIPMRKSA